MTVSFALEPSAFSKDLCKCGGCGAVLSRHNYGFNEFGQTLELCPNCPPRLMLMRKSVPVITRSPKVHFSGLDQPRCACGMRLKRKNAIMCFDCRAEHRKAQHRAYTAKYALTHKSRKHRASQ